jgi:recombination protein RecT
MTQLSTQSAPPKKAFRELIESSKFKDQIAAALPKHLTSDRFVRVLLTATIKVPKLAECTQASVFKSIFDCAAMGLEPDGRRAHLIPYENRRAGTVECQLIIDYKGLAELAMRSGAVAYLHADVVREGDVFDYSMGELRSHVPHFLRRDDHKPEQSGKVFAAYALVRMKDGTAKAEVMSRDDIEAIRSRSRAGGSGPWVTDWNEMAKKTAFRRLSKWLPLSPEIRDAFDKDGDTPDPLKTAKSVFDEGAGAALNELADAADAAPAISDEDLKGAPAEL